MLQLLNSQQCKLTRQESHQWRFFASSLYFKKIVMILVQILLVHMM